MHGPPRNYDEFAATLDHEVKRLTEQGLHVDPAIRVVAARHGLKPYLVMKLANYARRRRRECSSVSSST